MRRLFMLLAAPAVAALAVGCCHTHGVCDCDYDDHCATRAPWVAYSPAPDGAVPYHGPETIPAPKAMPKTAAPKTAAPKTEAPRKLPDVAPKF